MLVVSQVAVSLVLLVAVGLVLRSYSAARLASGGFESANVTSIAIDLQTVDTTARAGPVAVTRLLDALATEPSSRAGHPPPQRPAEPWSTTRRA
jgi:hypothetical protein